MTYPQPVNDSRVLSLVGGTMLGTTKKDGPGGAANANRSLTPHQLDSDEKGGLLPMVEPQDSQKVHTGCSDTKSLAEIMASVPAPPDDCPACRCLTAASAKIPHSDRVSSAHYRCGCGASWTVRWAGHLVAA